jgi:hypothetical protein
MVQEFETVLSKHSVRPAETVTLAYVEQRPYRVTRFEELKGDGFVLLSVVIGLVEQLVNPVRLIDIVDSPYQLIFQTAKPGEATKVTVRNDSQHEQSFSVKLKGSRVVQGELL